MDAAGSKQTAAAPSLHFCAHQSTIGSSTEPAMKSIASRAANLEPSYAGMTSSWLLRRKS